MRHSSENAGIYPRMNPTIDITAAVRPYVNRLASHAVGSGNVSMNHSWKTGLNLLPLYIIHTKSKRGMSTHTDNILSLYMAIAAWSSFKALILRLAEANSELYGERTRLSVSSYLDEEQLICLPSF